MNRVLSRYSPNPGSSCSTTDDDTRTEDPGGSPDPDDCWFKILDVRSLLHGQGDKTDPEAVVKVKDEPERADEISSKLKDIVRVKVEAELVEGRDSEGNLWCN
uniref:uncharacterized protein isoform X2 n=1 Tax=Myxine glutinosa TaxID=7769 RepID=UPI00358EF4DD